MTITQLIDLIRKQCYVESNQMDDDELITYLNLAYHDIENTIVTNVNEDFFYQQWKTNMVDNQSEYTFEPSSATALWFKKILQVEVKRTTDQEYYDKLEHENIQLFDSARDVLQASQAPWFYDLKDSSIFLYPTPDENVVDWLRVSWVINLIDLNDTDTAETFIFPDHSDLRQFIPMLAMGAKPYVYQARGLIDLKNDAKSEYAYAKKEMVKQLSNRDSAPMEQDLPNWDIYK